MKKLLWKPILLVVLSLGTEVQAAALPVPPMGQKERGIVVTSLKETGVKRWQAEWTLEQIKGQEGQRVKFTEAGSGRYGKFDGQVSWRLEATWTAASLFQPVHSLKEFHDKEGKLLSRERKVLDFTRGEAKFEREDPATGKVSARSFSLSPDTLIVEGIGTALRSLPFDPPGEREFHFLTNEPRMYRITMKPRGRERIKAPAGEFECYKYEMVVNLGLLGLLRVFIPKTYFWFTVDPPHFWVRYEGLESGLGSPYVVMELEAFEH